ncbi:MAG: hypothetical protein ABIY51_13780 [Ferruginibacter sp.]
MKRLILFIILVGCFCLHSYAQVDSINCSRFRTGRFAYTDDSARSFIIKRTNRIQEETEPATNIVTRFRIKWHNPCSYELKQLWSNSKSKRKNNGATSEVIITGTGIDQYSYTCNCKGLADDKKVKGIVYKLP